MSNAERPILNVEVEINCTMYQVQSSGFVEALEFYAKKENCTK